MPATATPAAVSRITKLLALAASAAMIGSPNEASAAIVNAQRIAEREGIDIEPLAFRAGVIIPRPVKPREIESGVYVTPHYTLTRTTSADEVMEICTRGAHGRTECYMDVDGDGIRMFLGYADELDRDVWQQFAPLLRIHWRTFDRHFPV